MRDSFLFNTELIEVLDNGSHRMEEGLIEESLKEVVAFKDSIPLSPIIYSCAQIQ